MKLQNMIKLHRKPNGYTSFADREALMISRRLKLVDELSSKVTHFKLLKRYYLIELTDKYLAYA